MATILQWLAKGVSVSTAAAQAKVDRTTVYAWRDAYPEFAGAWDAALKQGIEHVEDIIRNAASKDWRAGEAWLRAHNRDKWGTQKTENVNLNAEAADADELADLMDVLDGRTRPAGAAQAQEPKPVEAGGLPLADAKPLPH